MYISVYNVAVEGKGSLLHARDGDRVRVLAHASDNGVLILSLKVFLRLRARIRRACCIGAQHTIKLGRIKSTIVYNSPRLFCACVVSVRAIPHGRRTCIGVPVRTILLGVRMRVSALA